MFVSGKVVLVTGGASGIGLCYVKELLRNNAKVCIVDVNVENGNNVLKDLEKEYGIDKCIFCKADVTNKKELEDAMKRTVDQFGHFDVLVNNAGLMDDSIWEREIDVNLKGAINGCILGMEHYLPKYRSTQKAVIVNISSTLGLEQVGEFPVYSATKHGLIGLGKSLSAEINHRKQKIDVITICPDATETDLILGFPKKGLNQRYNNMMTTFLNTRASSPQKPEDVAKHVVDIINNCKNGEFWEIRNGKKREIVIRNAIEYK